jgi:nucleotide-binding universal stress UspA family protein
MPNVVTTILVGYDGTDAGERVLRRAAEFAKALSAGLVVVSVTARRRRSADSAVESALPLLVPVAGVGATVEGTAAVLEEQPNRQPEAEEISRRQLERARSALARLQLDAEYVAEVGDPADRLLAQAEARHADVIVVGSRQHGFVERLLGAGVDQLVARGTDRDVLLVH